MKQMKEFIKKNIVAVSVIGSLVIIAILLQSFGYGCATAPTITEIIPTKDETNVGIDVPVIIIFNKKISASDFSVMIEPKEENILEQFNNKELLVNFNQNLKTNQKYTFTLISKKKFFNIDKQRVDRFSWNFTTGVNIVDNLNDGPDLTDYYKKYPLAEFLPIEADHFSISGPDENGVFTISLNAIFNATVSGPPIEEQEARYHQELKQYKQEALDWIKSNGINPNSFKINWIPEEAANY